MFMLFTAWKHDITIKFFALTLFFIPLVSQAQENQPEPAVENNQTIANATEAVDALLAGEETGMTLDELLINGGWVMWVLAFLSVLALALILYFFFALREKKLVPRELTNQIRLFIKDNRYEDIARICKRNKGMLSKVVLSGLLRGSSDPQVVANTMETVGRRESESMMRKVRYLSDIGTVAPMLGLLGTVIGMISAFNLIAFDISAVKPVALASAVAQALVTTAAGLIVAIPCMGFFFYFRGKLQSLVSQVEEIAVEIADSLTELDTNLERGQTKTIPRKTIRRHTGREQL